MRKRKRIYDSVHRFIHVDELENALINTRPFQRLHYIHQLGVTYLVYPGGTHRRFAHSLGVMEIATRIYDTVTQPNKLHKLSGLMPEYGSPEHRYWRRVLRLASLCHDIGHLPFSHVAESKLIGTKGHEVWTRKILESEAFDSIWEQFHGESLSDGINRDVRGDVMYVALGEKNFKEKFTPWEYIVTEIITGDFFGADRIDYLLRDSQCTGLSYGVFDYHQLIEMLKIIVTKEGSLTLGIEENGMDSYESLMLARHYMHKRLYQYPNVKAYAYHLVCFMEKSYCDIGKNLNHYISITDNEVLAELNRASGDETRPGHVDAQYLCLRRDPFRAIPFTSRPDRGLLLAVKERLKDKIDWELCKNGGQRVKPSFPVLKRDGSVDIGENLSELTVAHTDRSWVYVAPQYEEEIRRIFSPCSESCPSN